MKDGPEVSRISTAVIAGVCGFALAAGGGIALWTANRSPNSAETHSSAPTTAPALSPTPAESPAVIIPVPPPNPVEVPRLQTPQTLPQQALVSKSPQPKPLPEAGAPTVQVYWVKGGGKFEAVPTKVAVKPADEPDTALEAAFNSLLAGPKDATVYSEIPQGTKLRSLSVKNDGVYVDFSANLLRAEGSTSMTGRLGQVIYTATSLKPNAKVWISVDGKPLELLGGEGLEVAQPSTRQSFDKNFPL